MRLIFSESTVLKINGKWTSIDKGSSLLLSPNGQTIDEDSEIILNNERYYVEAGDKVIITNGVIAEALGFKVITKGLKQPIDLLIGHLELSNMNWDINNPDFAIAASKFFKPVPVGEEWIPLLSSSNQDIRLREHLKALTLSQIGLEDGEEEAYEDDETGEAVDS